MRVVGGLLTLVLAAAGCGRLEFTDQPRADSGPLPAGGPDGGELVDGSPDAEVFAYSCALDLTTPGTSCEGLGGSTDASQRYVTTIDMTGYTELRVAMTICDPVDWVAHLADSPTCNGFSGDGGTSANDSEIHIDGATQLDGYSNDTAALGTLFSQPGFVAATGCTEVEWRVGDGHFHGQGLVAVDQDSPGLLRIDPPTDSEGTPDALWYLGLNTIITGAGRVGSGVRSATIQLR